MGLKDADSQGKGPATDETRVERATTRSSEDKGWGKIKDVRDQTRRDIDDTRRK